MMRFGGDALYAASDWWREQQETAAPPPPQLQLQPMQQQQHVQLHQHQQLMQGGRGVLLAPYGATTMMGGYDERGPILFEPLKMMVIFLIPD